MKNKKLSFEEALAELEKTAAALDSGNTGLEESISLYERGSELITYCEKLLNEAEQKISLIKKNSDDSFEVTSFDGI